MVIINGAFNMTLQPGYPKFKGESANESLTFLYKTSNLAGAPLALYGDACPGNATLKLASIETEYLPDGVGGIISYTYKSPDLVRPDGSIEIECRNEELAVPIENHDNYLRNWNHELHAKSGVTSTPDWWATADNTHVPPAAADGKPEYIWAKPGDQPQPDYRLLLAATKPGVESFKSYVPKITWSKKHASKSSAQNHAANDGTIQTPPDTFGYPGQWLQAGSSIKKDGGSWTEEITYIGSMEIDPDIYQ